LTGSLKKRKVSFPEESGKMGYLERWVGDGIYTVIGEGWDIYSDG